MGDITLRKALEEYKDIYLASRNFAPGTRVEYLNDIEGLVYFLEQIGLKEVKEVGFPQLERYLAELDRRGNKGSTRKRKVISIKSFLSYLYQYQYISINLARKLILPFVEARSPRFLTKPEYERLLQACAHNPRDFALMQLILQTGIKLSEVTELMVDDIEFSSIYSTNSYIHIMGSKTRKSRLIPLNARGAAALKAYLRERDLAQNTELFISRLGKPLRQRGVEKVVSKYLVKAGIRNASIQSLRHTFAVHSLLSGVGLKSLKDMMGYRDNRTATIYLLAKKAIDSQGFRL